MPIIPPLLLKLLFPSIKDYQMEFINELETNSATSVGWPRKIGDSSFFDYNPYQEQLKEAADSYFLKYCRDNNLNPNDYKMIPTIGGTATSWDATSATRTASFSFHIVPKDYKPILPPED